MQVSNPNNVKIYNLSAGKSLPEWLTDKKKRALQKSDLDVRRRLELIQDFEMPACSSRIKLSADRQYILATGVYKPRVRCYDVSQMSLKFERCFDSEVINFVLLSEDYSKIVFLHNDRNVEFHTEQGRYYRTRLPKYGIDLAYHPSSADVYFVGVSEEIFRFNLEVGRYMMPLKSNATEINCCQFNPCHELFACGTKEGQVECFDPRSRNRVGVVDCAARLMSDSSTEVLELPTSITSLTFKDAMLMAVGTNTGQVLVYDIRMSKPVCVKSHMYGLPILDVVFDQDLIISCDSRIVKIWNRNTGKPFTSIETESPINSLCKVPSTGMLFLANESPKIQTYYIPALGPAPKWCSFLESLTEELEETTPTVYDNYKFLTRPELESVGLSDLVGTNLLRSYMHGFFIDHRLYNKAKSLVDPFSYSEYREKTIRGKREVEGRVKVNKIPQVNKRLAAKLMENDTTASKHGKKSSRSSLLQDKRFSEMFLNPQFEVDEESEEFRLLNPVVAKLDHKRRDQIRIAQEMKDDDDDNEEEEVDVEGNDESSSDDEHTWKKEVKQEHRLRMMSRRSLGKRVQAEEDDYIADTTVYGNVEMTYSLKKSPAVRRREDENNLHLKERKRLRRSTAALQPRVYRR